jgi:cytochrome c-type biogenesis protein CcmE
MSAPSNSNSNLRGIERPGWAFWVGIIVAAAAVFYVVTSAMGSTTHAYDVDQAVTDPTLVGENMRIRGFVVEGSHLVRQGTLDDHVFLLSLKEETITVRYRGALPDQFQDGARVLATGQLTDSDTFQAEVITAQCPSRYDNAAPTASSNDSLGVVSPLLEEGTAQEPVQDSDGPSPVGPYIRSGQTPGGGANDPGGNSYE